MTPEELQRLEAIEAAMTPGPVITCRINDDRCCSVDVLEAVRCDDDGNRIDGPVVAFLEHPNVSQIVSDADADGLAAMRNAFPGLLAEVRRLRKALTPPERLTDHPATQEPQP